jgi:hypothetical protein
MFLYDQKLVILHLIIFVCFHFQALAVELQQPVEENKLQNSIIAFCNEVLNSPRSTQFVNSLLHTPSLACPLLRLMTTTAVSEDYIIFDWGKLEVIP